MKRKNTWIAFQILQLIILLLFGCYLFFRKYDGHGTLNTFDVKIITLKIWFLFCISLVAIEWIIYIIKYFLTRNK